MKTIKEYILEEFYNLDPEKRVREQTLNFADWMKIYEDEEFLGVMEDIDFSNLNDSLTSHSFKDTGNQVRLAQDLIVIAFDSYIDDKRDEIGYEIEDVEENGSGVDAEFRRNGFASEADYNQWRFG